MSVCVVNVNISIDNLKKKNTVSCNLSKAFNVSLYILKYEVRYFVENVKT